MSYRIGKLHRNRLFSLATFLSFFLFGMNALAFSNAIFVQTGDDEQLTQVDVFIAGENGYHTFRIPSLITAPNGALVAICEGRKKSARDDGDIDIVCKHSSDNGTTWGPLKVIYEEGGNANITIGNPCTVVDRQTRKILMTFTKNNDAVFCVESSDNGNTWSKPRAITRSVKNDNWTWYATGPGVGIQMSVGKHSGRLIVPCDHREERGGSEVKMSHVFYSDDHGKTWRLGGTVGDHTDECQVVELNDGRLMINMRNYWAAEGGQQEYSGKRAVAFSSDGGVTWGEITFDANLIEPICQASIHTFSNDATQEKFLLFSNPASKTKRQQMTVRLSRDQGRTWPIQKVLNRGHSAYSCLATVGDHSIGCLYERGEKSPYEKITFARFTSQWLLK